MLSLSCRPALGRMLARTTFSTLSTQQQPAEVRAQHILSGVLSTLYTPLQDTSVNSWNDPMGGYLPQFAKVFDSKNALLATQIHSHPNLQKLYDEILKMDSSKQYWMKTGFTIDILKTMCQRIGGDDVAAETMMCIMDTNNDGIVTWPEFWGYTVVMEDGLPDEKVSMLLRGGDVQGNNMLSRQELSDLTASVYLGALAMRGKTHDMNLLQSAHVDVKETRFLPDGMETSLKLLSEPVEDWINPATGNVVPVAILERTLDEATLQEFARVVGDVAANYAFVAANKEGDELNITELEEWVREEHPSFQFLRQLFLSTQIQGRKERIELIQYLEENHKVVEIESDNSMLGLLKQEVRDNLA